MIEYAREHQICRIDLVATDEDYTTIISTQCEVMIWI